MAAGAVFLLYACGSPKKEEESELVPKTNVQITHVHKGSIHDELELFASTLYLKRNVINAPFPAFITHVNIRLGDKVKEGDILYTLESKEKRALGNDLNQLDTSLTSFGVIEVKAQASGVVSTLDKQQIGDYVLEGTQLCTISESNDLAFQVNVPFEFRKFVNRGKHCRIILPDNSIHSAIISTPLSSMNITAQTQSVLAKSVEPLFLPENLIVTVMVDKGNGETQQIIPITCVQSDERMQHFWVMKLLNDSTAVQVAVRTGNKNHQEIEILQPHFDSTDRIIVNGSYGLADTALVQIVGEDHGE